MNLFFKTENIKNLILIFVNIGSIIFCYQLFQSLNHFNKYYEEKLYLLELEKASLKETLVDHQQKIDILSELVQKETTNTFFTSTNVVFFSILSISLLICIGISLSSSKIIFNQNENLTDKIFNQNENLTDKIFNQNQELNNKVCSFICRLSENTVGTINSSVNQLTEATLSELNKSIVYNASKLAQIEQKLDFFISNNSVDKTYDIVTKILEKITG